MSSYPPPTENLQIFNAGVFETTSTPTPSTASLGLTTAVYASITFPVGSTLSLALAEPLFITAAGNWLVTGKYLFTSVLAASNIDNDGTSFLVWDYTTTHSARSSQLHSTNNGTTLNSYTYTHTNSYRFLCVFIRVNIVFNVFVICLY